MEMNESVQVDTLRQVAVFSFGATVLLACIGGATRSFCFNAKAVDGRVRCKLDPIICAMCAGSGNVLCSTRVGCSTRESTAHAHGCSVRACLCHCCGHPWCYPGPRPDRILPLRLCWPTSAPQVSRPPPHASQSQTFALEGPVLDSDNTHFAGTDGVIGLIPAGDSGVDSDTFRYRP